MKKLLLYSFIIILLFSSCTLYKVSGRGNLPLVLNNLPSNSKLIKHFIENKMIVFDWTGSIDVSNIINEVLEQNKDANAVTNVAITIKSDVRTFFINILTLSLARAYVAEVEGDLIKSDKLSFHENEQLKSYSFDDEINMTIDEINNSSFVITENGINVYSAK